MYKHEVDWQQLTSFWGLHFQRKYIDRINPLFLWQFGTCNFLLQSLPKTGIKSNKSNWQRSLWWWKPFLRDNFRNNETEQRSKISILSRLVYNSKKQNKNEIKYRYISTLFNILDVHVPRLGSKEYFFH